jgi:hypothetical protein
MPKETLQALLEPVWTGKQSLVPVYRPLETEIDQPEHIADGFSYTVTSRPTVKVKPMSGKSNDWSFIL